MLDEATMRATAIHDGAERRLNLLTSRHTETMRRLTEIRDVVTNLVSSETARGSLEEEVAKSVATGVAAGAAPAQAPAARGAAEGRHTPGGQQLPGRGGRDVAAEAARPAPARTAQRPPSPAGTAGTTEDQPSHADGSTAADPAPAKPAPRPAAGGGAHASGTRPNQPE